MRKKLPAASDEFRNFSLKLYTSEITATEKNFTNAEIISQQAVCLLEKKVFNLNHENKKSLLEVKMAFKYYSNDY